MKRKYGGGGCEVVVVIPPCQICASLTRMVNPISGTYMIHCCDEINGLD